MLPIDTGDVRTPKPISPEKLILPRCPNCGRPDATPFQTSGVFTDAPMTYFRCRCGLVWSKGVERQ